MPGLAVAGRLGARAGRRGDRWRGRGAAYENWHRAATEGQVGGRSHRGRRRSQAPLPAGNHSVASVAQQLLPSTIQVLAQYQGKKDGATGLGLRARPVGPLHHQQPRRRRRGRHDGPIEIVDQNGDKYPAKVVGRSPTYDLAVLYVKDGPQLPPASLGTARVLRVGDQVVAFGSPLGPQLDGHLRHRQRAEPAGDHQRLAGRRRRTSTPCRPTPRSTPATPAGRWSTCPDGWSGSTPRSRPPAAAATGEAGNIGVGLRDPDRPGEDHRRPDPAHRPGALPGDRRDGEHRRQPPTSARRSSRCNSDSPADQGRSAQGRRGHRGRRARRSPTGSP